MATEVELLSPFVPAESAATSFSRLCCESIRELSLLRVTQTRSPIFPLAHGEILDPIGRLNHLESLEIVRQNYRCTVQNELLVTFIAGICDGR